MSVDDHVCSANKAKSRADVLKKLCDTYGVHDIYAFGSRAGEMLAWIRGDSVQTAHPDSDVDIGVLPLSSAKWDAERKVKFSMELEDLFSVSRVDLVLLPEAEPFLTLDIIRGELLYTIDADEQARYELFVLRRAGDLLPFKKERIRMILEEGGR
ncbi:MAG: nucleotidyltransferase domain-containing protein [Desulfohalobiaceae bacterium]